MVLLSVDDPQRTTTSPSISGLDNIQAFFDAYPLFDYDSANDPQSEWRRLCEEHLDIDPDDNDIYEVRETKRKLRTAMVRQFNATFGEDADDLDAWQALCRKVDISVPDTLEECQQVRRRLCLSMSLA